MLESFKMLLRINILLLILSDFQNSATVSKDFTNQVNYETDSSVEDLFSGKSAMLSKNGKS